MDTPTLVTLILAAVVVLVGARSIRIVPQAELFIIERLGKYSRTLQPGLHVLVPMLDSVKVRIDMREQVVTFPPQPVISLDNVTVTLGATLHYTVTDPIRATYQVAQLSAALEQLTLTTLRNLLGELTLGEAMAAQDQINTNLRMVLDTATEAWGIRISRIDIEGLDQSTTLEAAAARVESLRAQLADAEAHLDEFLSD